MPQQSVPFGDAYILQTPKTDRAIALMYQDQKQRQAQQYAEQKASDDLMSKEFANVRSADMNDVAQKWDQYKQLRKNVLFNKDLQSDPVKYNQANRAAQIALSDVYGTINESKEQKDRDKLINERKATHPNEFTDEGIVQHTQDLSLPTNERLKQGRTDISSYLDNSPQTDFGKISKEAMGQKQTLPLGKEMTTSDQWQIEQPQMARYNTPTQYYSNVMRSLMTGKSGKDAARIVDNMQPSQVAKIIDDYKSIPDNVFQQQFGIDKDELLKSLNTDNKTQRFAALDAMNYATQFKPEILSSKFRDNKEYIDNLKDSTEFSEWMIKNKITSEQAKDRAKLYRQFQSEKEKENLGAAEDYLKKSGTGKTYPGKLGEDVEVINLPEIITNQLKNSDGKPVKNIGLYNGKYIDVKTHPNGEIDFTKSKEIPLIQIKSAITNKALPSNFKVKQVTGTPTSNKQKIAGF